MRGACPRRGKCGTAATQHREAQATNLRIVDPTDDDGVWVIVDDAFNSG